jgi:hypothetical protein
MVNPPNIHSPYQILPYKHLFSDQAGHIVLVIL